VRPIAAPLLVLLLLLPTGAAIQPCGDAVCATAGSARSGSGSCEASSSSYAEATEVTVISGLLRATHVSVYSHCHRAGEQGYRELGVSTSANGRETSFEWFEASQADASVCRMRVDRGADADSVPCPASAPPMLPRLP
jgi:hypothetical protein